MGDPGGPGIVVTADDFGLSPAVSEGILESYRDGMTTGTTWMATFPEAAESAAQLLAEPGLDVGIHLDLTAGAPCAAPSGLGPLVAPSGAFAGLGALVRAWLIRELDPAAVAREWSAQIAARRVMRPILLFAHEPPARAHAARPPARRRCGGPTFRNPVRTRRAVQAAAALSPLRPQPTPGGLWPAVSRSTGRRRDGPGGTLPHATVPPRRFPEPRSRWSVIRGAWTTCWSSGTRCTRSAKATWHGYAAGSWPTGCGLRGGSR